MFCFIWPLLRGPVEAGAEIEKIVLLFFGGIEDKKKILLIFPDFYLDTIYMSLGACNSSLFIPFIATVCPNRKPISVLRALQQSPKSVAALIRIRLTAWKKLADICFFLSEIPYPILWWIVFLLTISYTYVPFFVCNIFRCHL